MRGHDTQAGEPFGVAGQGSSEPLRVGRGHGDRDQLGGMLVQDARGASPLIAPDHASLRVRRRVIDARAAQRRGAHPAAVMVVRPQRDRAAGCQTIQILSRGPVSQPVQ